LVDHSFFGRYYPHFKEIEFRGYYNSYLFTQFIYAAISAMVEDEKATPLNEKDASNLLFVLKKK